MGSLHVGLVDGDEPCKDGERWGSFHAGLVDGNRPGMDGERWG